MLSCCTVLRRVSLISLAAIVMSLLSLSTSTADPAVSEDSLELPMQQALSDQLSNRFARTALADGERPIPSSEAQVCQVIARDGCSNEAGIALVTVTAFKRQVAVGERIGVSEATLVELEREAASRLASYETTTIFGYRVGELTEAFDYVLPWWWSQAAYQFKIAEIQARLARHDVVDQRRRAYESWQTAQEAVSCYEQCIDQTVTKQSLGRGVNW